MGTITVRNVSGDPLDARTWAGLIVPAGESFDVEGHLVDRGADGVVVELDRVGQPIALPASQWEISGAGGDTRRDVLARVAGDPDRARAELAAEQAGPNRVTLVRDLERVVAGQAPDGDPIAAVGGEVTGELLGAVASRTDVVFAPGHADESNPAGLLHVDEAPAGTGQLEVVPGGVTLNGPDDDQAAAPAPATEGS